jgi:hypothetical protein
VGSFKDIHVADSVVLRANELREAQIPLEEIKATIKDEFRKETKANTHGQYPYRRSFLKAKNRHSVFAQCRGTRNKRPTNAWLGEYADIHVAESVVLRAN